MEVEVNEEPTSALEEYADTPIAFEVRSVLDITEGRDNHGGFILMERALAAPYVKDYDAIEGEHPTMWARRYDVSKWGLFAARLKGHRVGGAVVAYDTVDLDMLEGRQDLAVLWDIRVSPLTRGKGIGSKLFRAAEA